MTTAIVKVTDGTGESYSIFCNGDGDLIGKEVQKLCDKALEIDTNEQKERPAGLDCTKEDWHHRSVPNVSSEASKFLAVLIGELWKTYGGVYLTHTDLKAGYRYEVMLKQGKKPKLIRKRG